MSLTFSAVCDKRNNFCYVCGLFADKKHRLDLKTNKALVNAFNTVFNCSYSSSKWYEPESICTSCSSVLKKTKSEKFISQPLPISFPMIWHHQIFHKPQDCYFCQTNITGYQYKNRDSIKYANVLTVAKPVLSAIKCNETSHKQSDDESENEECDMEYLPKSAEPHFVTNGDFCDLVRDLKLSWRQTEVLGSRLKQWNITQSDFKVTFPRDNPQSCFEEIFKASDGSDDLVYCSNIEELFFYLNHQHEANDWRLFLDGSCKSRY